MRTRPLARQRGVVLIVALIILVAMTLGGIAIARSVDTGNVIAGNLAFKQAAIQAGDQGLETAFRWLDARRSTATLNSTDMAAGYFSSQPPTGIDWQAGSTWASAVRLPTDAAGNTVSYLIHRMCSQPNTAYNGTSAGGIANECAISMTGGGADGGSKSSDGLVLVGNAQLYYRITARVEGPRNTVGIVQATVLVTN